MSEAERSLKETNCNPHASAYLREQNPLDVRASKFTGRFRKLFFPPLGDVVYGCSLNKPFLSFSGPILEEQKLLILQREIDLHVRRFDTFDKEKHENQTGQGNLLRGIDNCSVAARSVLQVR